MWRMLDLFSGIGGFSLAAQWVWRDELEIVAFCEIDKFCQKILKKHWPSVSIIEDVRDVTKEALYFASRKWDEDPACICGTGIICPKHSMAFSESRESWKSPKSEGGKDISRRGQEIDLLTGGFPCQPFSCAGKRKGKEDNRFLWPEMFRIIKEIRPRWVIVENVAGIVRMALDDCLFDLEGEGYSTGTVILPACSQNAPHRRDRVWIVAYNEKQIDWKSISKESKGQIQKSGKRDFSADVADSNTEHSQEYIRRNQLGYAVKERSFRRSDPSGRGQWSTQSRLGGMVNGIPDWSYEPESVSRVAKGIKERVNRLKSLGNAIVPQVAYQIMKAIKEIEEK